MNRIGTAEWASLWKVTWRGLKFVFFVCCLWETAVHAGEFPIWLRVFPFAMIATAVLAVWLIRRFVVRPVTLSFNSNGLPVIRPAQWLRTLSFNSKGLRYKDRYGEQWTISWERVTAVKVSREFGFSSLEWNDHDTAWLIEEGRRTKRMWDEYCDNAQVMAGFNRYLPSFSPRQAELACISEELGETTCFARKGEP